RYLRCASPFVSPKNLLTSLGATSLIVASLTRPILMRFTQLIFSSPIPPRALAASLVAWLDRSRVPAVFQLEDDATWDTSCRKQLREYADSWISAKCRLDSWSRREELESVVRYATTTISQATNKPVNTTIRWGMPAAHAPVQTQLEGAVW